MSVAQPVGDERQGFLRRFAADVGIARVKIRVGPDCDRLYEKPLTPDSRQTRRICIRDQIVEEEGYESREDALGKSGAR